MSNLYPMPIRVIVLPHWIRESLAARNCTLDVLNRSDEQAKYLGTSEVLALSEFGRAAEQLLFEYRRDKGDEAFSNNIFFAYGREAYQATNPVSLYETPNSLTPSGEGMKELAKQEAKEWIERLKAGTKVHDAGFHVYLSHPRDYATDAPTIYLTLNSGYFKDKKNADQHELRLSAVREAIKLFYVFNTQESMVGTVYQTALFGQYLRLLENRKLYMPSLST